MSLIESGPSGLDMIGINTYPNPNPNPNQKPRYLSEIWKKRDFPASR